jgi:hypothetical protein
MEMTMTSVDEQVVESSNATPVVTPPRESSKPGEPPTAQETRQIKERPVTGPDAGFGQLWRKTYRIPFRDSSATAREIIATWKRRFPDFWPPGNDFFAPLRGIQPGEMAVIKVDMPGPAQLTTGVYVLHADDVSFSLLTPKGHMFAGKIDFRAKDSSDGAIVEVEILLRANDPLYEIGLKLGGAKHEDEFWEQTLQRLGAAFGVSAPVSTTIELVDKHRKWANIGNIRYNDGIRSGFRGVTRPMRWGLRRLGLIDAPVRSAHE